MPLGDVNNPVMKIDPDGKDDYYTSDGKFLGSNNKKTDYIYISDNYKQQCIVADFLMLKLGIKS